MDAATIQFCSDNLNETEEGRNEAVKELQKWSQENPHLHIKDDCKSLIAFLRSCKFNLDRTKAKLEDYFTMKRDIPEWYYNRDPNLCKIEELVKLGVFLPLKQHFENQLVVIIRAAAHNPRIHKQDDVFKAGNMILDVATKEDEMAQIYGIIAIFDMDGLSFGHARALTTSIIKKAVRSWQNYHCRPKKLEFVNAPIYINVVLSIFKGFMSEKLQGRVRVHYGGSESMHTIVDKAILPTNYGGDGDSIEDLAAFWLEKLKDNTVWFRDDEKFRAE